MSNQLGELHIHMSGGSKTVFNCTEDEAQKYIQSIGQGQHQKITDETSGKITFIHQSHIVAVEFTPDSKDTP